MALFSKKGNVKKQDLTPKSSDPEEFPTPKSSFWTVIQICIVDDKEEDRLWQEASKKHFLKAYEEDDAIYDKL